MKKLKVLVCALFVLCGGLIFCACGKSEFDSSKITLGDTQFVYNGESRAFLVDYEDARVDVTYSFSKDEDSFKSIKSLDVTNVGTYELYYKLSAKGFKDYISSKPVTVVINKADFVVDLKDYNLFKSVVNESWSQISVMDNVESANENCITKGAFGTDDVNFKIIIGNEKTETEKAFDLNTIVYGEEYLLDCSISNPNYNLVKTEASQNATINIVDHIQINGADGDTKTYHSTLSDAVLTAESTDTIVLNSDWAMVEDMITVEKPITIDGRNVHTIVVSTGFQPSKYESQDIASLFNLADSSAVLTLKDLSINCSKRARAISAFAGKVVVDNSIIFNGKNVDDYHSGGVYITNNASFEMPSGRIVDNDANDAEYTKYCADIWVGANAVGSSVSLTGGTIKNVFVNSHEYSSGAGKFVLDGGNVENVFVECNDGYGAQFEYVKGEVESLMIALQNTKNGYCGEFAKTELVEGRTYFGGQLVYVEDEYNIREEIFTTTINDLLEDDKKYVFENCAFNTEVVLTKKVDITFNNCVFDTSAKSSAINLDVTRATNLVVANCTFVGNENSLYAIDVNLHSGNCDDIIISNCEFNLASNNDVAVAIKQRKGEHDNPLHDDHDWAETGTTGRILGNVKIVGNIMNENINVFIGDVPMGPNSTLPNSTTGDFHVFVRGNKEAISIHNKFKDSKNTQEPDIINLPAKGTFDSNN